MNKTARNILWFKEINKNDILLVGGKGANLGEMYNSGIPVPDGFVVTSTAYFDFINKTSLAHKIRTELAGLNVSNSKELFEVSKRIQHAFMSASLPDTLVKEIRDSYHYLCGEYDKKVAVRSSATAEDLPDASFAGQQETYLNIVGYKSVVDHVLKCFASLFEPRAIFYRTEKGFSHLKVGIAVPIQLMVQSEVSGIMFTVNPLTNNTDEIAIEAGFGLGQPIVSGEITPDQYLIHKSDLKILNKKIVTQKTMLTEKGDVEVSNVFSKHQKLDDAFIKKLAELGRDIEKHYGKPQDIEWSFEKNNLYIVQSRPVTTIGKNQSYKPLGEIKISSKVLLKGIAASPGLAKGRVRVLKSAKEIDKIEDGEILVTEMTNPDFVPAMKKAAAIVTEKGGRTSHAAIVSRELGIPAIVGCEMVLNILKPGEEITVDGSNGFIYEGNVISSVSENKRKEPIHHLKTATHIYVNLGEPELASRMASKEVDGVGLLRAEFMIAEMGTHPRKYIEDGESEKFVNKLAEGMLMFAESFSPRPVIYRATDFKANEYKNLRGGEKFEQDEPNPMIGFRGASRYVENPEVFKLELEALKIVRNKKGFKNIHLMIPFLRTVEELQKIKHILAESGLRRSGTFKLWIMVEVPSTMLLLEDFIKEGIDGVSIGSNDLTMLILGVDRDNYKVANVYDERNDAVMLALEKIVRTCAENEITCSICGQAPSEYPEMVEKLVSWGVTSVSVNPDVIDQTREIVFNAEKKVLINTRKYSSIEEKREKLSFSINKSSEKISDHESEKIKTIKIKRKK
ncbi:MAG: phosphoenolpyruvate synthase [Proteobacteria bacterium]|nr:phosphoenolpyruvate synthase [Pseudomonadota bacterium]